MADNYSRSMGVKATATPFDELVARARVMVASGSRQILGVVGTPGSGKSTVSAMLVEALGADAVLVPMDGFHLANRELNRLGRRARKGAPDTFDVGGYIALLERLANQRGADIYSPVFDRGLEESIGSAVAISSSVPLVITEGNYLLSLDHGWAAVRPLLDEAWFVEVDAAVRRDRLLSRRLSFGHPVEEAVAWVRDVDERNASLVEATRGRADLLLHVDSVSTIATSEPAAISQSGKRGVHK